MGRRHLFLFVALDQVVFLLFRTLYPLYRSEATDAQPKGALMAQSVRNADSARATHRASKEKVD
jgi:hypothetical protein